MPKTPFNWTCSYCGQATTIASANYHKGVSGIDVTIKERSDFTLEWTAISCPNPECGELTLDCSLFENGFIKMVQGSKWGSVGKLNDWKLLPRSGAKPMPTYIPEEIRNNYLEACLILNDSPKASAAMSRRCLQGIVRDFWEIPQKNRGNLGAELSFIRDEVDPETYAGIQAIREIGDIGAHMEKAVDTIVDVEPGEAELLVELIETLISDWYISRYRRSERHSELKKIVGQKRKAKITSKKGLDQEKTGAAK